MFKILIATVLVSCQSVLAGTITLSGGSQVTVNANEITTVTCEGSSGNKVPCYCASDSSGYYALRANINGSISVISPYSNYVGCLDFAKQNSFCL